MDEVGITVQETIRQILSGMEIQKVVSVDDFYTAANSYYEVAIALFQIARSNQNVKYSELIPRDVLNAPENIWTRRLKAFWSKAEPVLRLVILNELAVATGEMGDKNLPGDVRDLSLLKGLIPEDMFVALSPDEWDRDRDTILAEAQEGHRILCLFDQDLHLADRSDSAGMTLLQQTLATYGEGHVICGLLTQTISKDAELSKAREFASKMGLSLDQFLPLSKDRLRGDPMVFADGLRMTAMNYARERLSRQVTDITKQASKKAQQQMNDISVNDFEHIVIRSSEDEGVWEPDTLFRLFDLFRYNAFRAMALAPEKRLSLYGDIERIRAIRDIRTSDLRPDCPSDQVYRIRQAELFDTAELLNPAHQPIDLGDIFMVGPEQYYILLAQPCDLVVRKNGRTIDIVTLVQIRTYATATKDPDEVASFRLDYFVDQPGKKTFVKFRNSFQVSLRVLDLAVFNDDGRCRISLSDADAEKLSTLHESWRKRFEVLRQHYQSTHEEFQKIPYQRASKYHKKALKHLLLRSDKDIDLGHDASGAFEFDIQRVCRCRAPLSMQILSVYFSFLSRNPQEHDFARRRP